MMNSELIYQDERLDEFEELKVIQKKDGPCFSIDAVILARFASVREGDKIIDLGTGGGIISLLLASINDVEQIIAIEIQDELADIARRNVTLNNLSQKIEIVVDDLILANKHFPAGQCDLVVSNPPYRTVGSGRLNPNSLKAIARHEIKCTLDDVLKSAFYLLKNNGRFAVVYRPDRLVDLISGCRRHNLEPKRLQFVYPDYNRECNLILLEAVKNGQSDCKVLKPLILDESDKIAN
jgi:tRNA1Val (adenine37-N6)-methyltransferase